MKALMTGERHFPLRANRTRRDGESSEICLVRARSGKRDAERDMSPFYVSQ